MLFIHVFSCSDGIAIVVGLQAEVLIELQFPSPHLTPIQGRRL